MKKYNNLVSLAWISIAAGIFALASIILTTAGANYHAAVFKNPVLLLGTTQANVQMIKWGLVFSMFGYYLLLLPAVFYFRSYINYVTTWGPLISWCGASFILLGAVTAGILSVLLPAYISEFPIATAVEQVSLLRNFQLSEYFIIIGIRNIVSATMASAWFLGIGYALKKDQPGFGTATMVLGIASFLEAFGSITGYYVMAEHFFDIYLVLGAAWPVWLGIELLARNGKFTIRESAKKKKQEEIFQVW